MSDSAHLPVPEGKPVDAPRLAYAELPVEPQTPSTPTSTKAKKANPLIDLIDTEKTYVDNLTGIIRVRGDLPGPNSTAHTIFRK